MKKLFLILFVLITASIAAFAVDISDEVNDENVTENNIVEDKITADKVIETTLKEEKASEEKIPEDELNDDKVGKDTLPDIVAQINSMHDDEQKVKAWAKYNSEENYVIIDKKDCLATIYGSDGKEINSFEIGIGKEIGDDFNDTKGLRGKAKNTTPAGEYTLIPNIYNKSAYGDMTLSLGDKANKSPNTKKMVALHKVPKFREKDRLKKFYDGNIANNRMSHGCINFLEEDFKEFTKYIHGGFKVYILPEEDGNSLKLAKSVKGEYELVQTKY